MRFWPFGKKTEPEAEAETKAPPPDDASTPRPAAAAGVRESELVRRLLRIDFSTPNGEQEAGHLLVSSRGTTDEARVVDVLLERLQSPDLGEPLRVQTALVLVDRGERKRAEELVAHASSARARVVDVAGEHALQASQGEGQILAGLGQLCRHEQRAPASPLSF
ncbi:hypothetical protein EON77_03130, partial [bacterium]